MSNDYVPPTGWTGAPDDLVRTKNGARLHVSACPHLGSDIRLATQQELDDMVVCTWCQAELDGQGRQYFAHLAEAIRKFEVHVGNQPRVREALEQVQYDSLWMPNSASYVALGFEKRAVAWFGKTYAMPSRDKVIDFPDYASGGRGSGAEDRTTRGDLCVVHYVEMSLSGVCEQCAE